MCSQADGLGAGKISDQASKPIKHALETLEITSNSSRGFLPDYGFQLPRADEGKVRNTAHYHSLLPFFSSFFFFFTYMEFWGTLRPQRRAFVSGMRYF